jgi:hypothetical protein
MRFSKLIFIFTMALLFFASSCARAPQPSTPLETLEIYIKAVKRKDAKMMMRLLSDASVKMAEQQAKEQNVGLDEVLKNETLFTQDQKMFEYRNQKIEGERATIEVKNSLNTWDTVPFVLEEGIWKIDKQGIANQMMQQNEMDNQRLDEIINQGRQP